MDDERSSFREFAHAWIDDPAEADRAADEVERMQREREGPWADDHPVQAMVDAARESAENPCPPIFWFRRGDEEFCALRVGMSDGSDWEVKRKAQQPGDEEEDETCFQPDGSWVLFAYYTDDEMIQAFLAADVFSAR